MNSWGQAVVGKEVLFLVSRNIMNGTSKLDFCMFLEHNAESEPADAFLVFPMSGIF